MKIPYIIVVVIVYTLECASCAARLYLNDPVMQLLDGIVIIAVSNLISIFFFFVGFKVLYVAYKNQMPNNNMKTHITKVTLYIMASGVCFVGYSIATLLIITPPGWQVPEIALVWWFLFYFFLTSISLLQILAFNTSVRKDTSSGNKLMVSSKTVSTESHNSVSLMVTGQD